jgi:CheY-like chemotaxis protein
MADRILIVDDEVATCEVLAQRLSKEGYSCVLAHNGKEALHHYRTSQKVKEANL